jgi:carbonic anhydrase
MKEKKNKNERTNESTQTRKKIEKEEKSVERRKESQQTNKQTNPPNLFELVQSININTLTHRRLLSIQQHTYNLCKTHNTTPMQYRLHTHTHG